MTPWLSVVLPTYNGATHLATALESVRHEPLDGVEIIAVDDGSTDDTREILRSFGGDLPLTVIERAHVGNWTRTTNIGLRAAHGTFACFLHQDDRWLRGRITAVRRELERWPDVGMVIHHAAFIGPRDERLGPWRCPLEGGAVDRRLLVERLLVQNFIAIPSPVFRRDLALIGGGLDEALWYAADWDLWLRLARTAPSRLIDSTLTAFRIHPESQTMTRSERADDLREQMTVVFRRHLSDDIVSGVRRAATFSIQVNAALARATRGSPLPLPRLAGEFAALGPRGWHRYLRDSRIMERVTSRIRMRLRTA